MKNIRNNLVSLSVGQSISYVINFLSILLAARSLGVSEFGEFASLLAIVMVMSKIVDFGLGPIIFRELSKDTSKLNVFYNVISFRIILAIAVFIVYNVSILLLGFTTKEIFLSDILFVAIIISSRMANFREVLSTPFKATLRMHIPMLINIFDGVLLLIYVAILSIYGLKLEDFILGYVFSNFPGFIFLLYYLRKDYNYKFQLEFTNLKWLIFESLPLAGYVILMVIFEQADILLLSRLNGSYFTGVYSASTRLTMPLNIIPATIVTSIYPLIVKHRGKKEYERKIVIIFKILFFISFLFAIIFTFKSTSFIAITFGKQYLNSAVPAIFLFWTQIFLFFSFLGSDLLTAYDNQKWNFVYAVLVVIVNVSLDFILLPNYNVIGAGLSKLFSSFTGAVLVSYALKKNKIKYFGGDINILFPLIIVILTFFSLSFLPFFLYIVFAIISTYIMLRYYVLFSYEEISEIAVTLNIEQWVSKIFYDRAKA